MRWTKRPAKPSPKPGDARVVRRFLLLPRCVSGEYRWLEWAQVKQEAFMGWAFVPDIPSHEVLKWRDVAWADGEGK